MNMPSLCIYLSSDIQYVFYVCTAVSVSHAVDQKYFIIAATEEIDILAMLRTGIASCHSYIAIFIHNVCVRVCVCGRV